MAQLNNFHLIRTKAMPATNKKPSRVLMYSERFRRGHTIPFDGETASGTAQSYLEGKGFEFIGKVEMRDGSVALISETFMPI